MAPSLITKKLKFKPFREWVVGEPRLTPAGTKLPGVHKETSWGGELVSSNQRSFFAGVMNLVEQLERHKPFLKRIRSTGGTVAIFVHLPGDVNTGDSISWSDLKKLAALEIDLDVEVFPNFN
jgi:hypothetical protein